MKERTEENLTEENLDELCKSGFMAQLLSQSQQEKIVDPIKTIDENQLLQNKQSEEIEDTGLVKDLGTNVEKSVLLQSQEELKPIIKQNLDTSIVVLDKQQSDEEKKDNIEKDVVEPIINNLENLRKKVDELVVSFVSDNERNEGKLFDLVTAFGEIRKSHEQPVTNVFADIFERFVLESLFNVSKCLKEKGQEFFLQYANARLDENTITDPKSLFSYFENIDHEQVLKTATDFWGFILKTAELDPDDKNITGGLLKPMTNTAAKQLSNWFKSNEIDKSSDDIQKQIAHSVDGYKPYTTLESLTQNFITDFNNQFGDITSDQNVKLIGGIAEYLVHDANIF